MDIDLYQLPIPGDWNLTCPTCRYPLRYLPSHRCPECGRALDMPDIVKPWHRLRAPRFTGDERPVPDFGLVCADCGEPLAGAPADRCPHCRRPFDTRGSRPPGAWFAVKPDLMRGLPVQVVELILVTEFVPHVIRGRHSPFGFEPNLGWFDVSVASEFYFEFLWLMRNEQRRRAADRETDPDATWTCRACAETSPLQFEVCWNCGGPAPA